VIGTNDYKDTAGSDIVVITAGIARKPGMSRDDLLNTNYKIVKECTENAAKHSPNCIIIVVSNPLDAMCQVAYKVSGFPKHRVFGMAGVLDSARMRTFLAMELGVSVENVSAFVLGGHGDTMVPLPRLLDSGRRPDHGAAAERPDRRDREAHGERGSRDRGFAQDRLGLLRAVLVHRRDGGRRAQGQAQGAACCCYLEGEFGISGLYVGVPAQLGTKGVERIWEIKLTDEESAASEVGGGRQGAGRHHEAVGGWLARATSGRKRVEWLSPRGRRGSRRPRSRPRSAPSGSMRSRGDCALSRSREARTARCSRWSGGSVPSSSSGFPIRRRTEQAPGLLQRGSGSPRYDRGRDGRDSLPAACLGSAAPHPGRQDVGVFGAGRGIGARSAVRAVGRRTGATRSPWSSVPPCRGRRRHSLGLRRRPRAQTLAARARGRHATESGDAAQRRLGFE